MFVPHRACSVALGRVRTPRSAIIKKRHHYVATTYLDAFTTPDGKLWTYFDYPLNLRPSPPEAVGYSIYYYSQLRPDGRRDDNSLEDLWSAIETVWPETMAVIRGGRVWPATSFHVLGLVGITGVRVPAARHRHEMVLAAKLRA